MERKSTLLPLITPGQRWRPTLATMMFTKVVLRHDRVSDEGYFEGTGAEHGADDVSDGADGVRNMGCGHVGQ